MDDGSQPGYVHARTTCHHGSDIQGECETWTGCASKSALLIKDEGNSLIRVACRTKEAELGIRTSLGVLSVEFVTAFGIDAIAVDVCQPMLRSKGIG